VAAAAQEVLPLADRPALAAGSPQAGILALGTAAHEYLELDLRDPDAADPAEVATAIVDLREPRSTVGGVNLVAGIRPELWRRVEAPSVATVAAGRPGAGGSILLLQRWVHDTADWEALPVEEQERVIGRTKGDSTELDPEVRGPRSHFSRTDFEVDGEEQKIFRRNTPFGTVTEHGTVFVGFSREQRRLSAMLRRMAGSDDGVRDALTHSSHATSGAYYWIPPAESLLRHATPEDD
jgi:Dyp-type peroxidase, C-terminal